MESNSASSASRRPLAGDRVVEAAIAAVTGVALAAALALFIATPLHAKLSAWADATLHPYGVPAAVSVYVIYAIAIVTVIMLGVPGRKAPRYLLFLSWALYLPSILAFSRFDLSSYVLDGGLASLGSGLPPALVLAAGLLLVCVTLAQGAVDEHRTLRKSYLGRGARQEEVDAAIRGNLKYVALALAIAALLTAVVSVATTGLIGELAGLPGANWYLALAMAGGAVIACVLIGLLRGGEFSGAAAIEER